MNRVLFSIVAIVVVVCLCAAAQAQQRPQYVFADGVKCGAEILDAGKLANIEQESGTNKTLVTRTRWDADLGKYKTEMFLVQGDKMRRVQNKTTGECAVVITNDVPNTTVISYGLGITLVPSMTREEVDPRTGKDFPILIRSIRNR